MPPLQKVHGTCTKNYTSADDSDYTTKTTVTGTNCTVPLNVSVPFISRILRAKLNREIKGRKYQLHAKIGRNYHSISNCMVLICQNKPGPK